MFAAETGGQQLIEDDEATFDSEEGTAVAEFWQTMYDEGLAQKEVYNGDSFADQKSAMAIVGPWAIAVYGESVDWGAVPVPTSSGTSPEETYTFSDAKNIGLYSACENQGTAWEVLKFATSEEQDGKLLEMTGQMPLRSDLAGHLPRLLQGEPGVRRLRRPGLAHRRGPQRRRTRSRSGRRSVTRTRHSVIFGKAPVDDVALGRGRRDHRSRRASPEPDPTMTDTRDRGPDPSGTLPLEAGGPPGPPAAGDRVLRAVRGVPRRRCSPTRSGWRCG